MEVDGACGVKVSKKCISQLLKPKNSNSWLVSRDCRTTKEVAMFTGRNHKSQFPILELPLRTAGEAVVALFDQAVISVKI